MTAWPTRKQMKGVFYLLYSAFALVQVQAAFAQNLLKDFSQWQFNSAWAQQLPIEPPKGNHIRQVHGAVFSRSEPTPLRNDVRLRLLSREAIENCLELDFAEVRRSNEFRDFVNGVIKPGNVTLTHRYGGHQFGDWAGQLGDGRAHFLGEYVNRRQEHWELQLKGSGKTPYSRHGDGRAVLRSSIREFLASEAMHHLGVPTSRAVALADSADLALRDPTYNGTVLAEKTAIVLRLAPSWLRFGSLEILAKSGEVPLLRTVLDFAIRHHFSDVTDTDDPDRFVKLFAAVQNRTAHMIVRWMTVGFAHGVCNTDNFSLLSITIDYGPFGFMDSYDPNFIPNLSDDSGLYAMHRQPSAALFNLHKLYEAISIVMTRQQRETARKGLRNFEADYQRQLLIEFRRKLGLIDSRQGDAMLVASLLHLMRETGADFTASFRQLADLTLDDLESGHVPSNLWAWRDLSTHKLFKNWCKAYCERVSRAEPTLTPRMRRSHMNAVNPRYVLRNWMAESAIRKATEGDYSEAWRIHMVLKRPFEEQVPAEDSGYADRPPKWSRNLKVSCSS